MQNPVVVGVSRIVRLLRMFRKRISYSLHQVLKQKARICFHDQLQALSQVMTRLIS